MPRLTHHDYFHAHDQLRTIWLHNPRVFGFLTSREQWCLHDYFQPAKDLSTLALLQHREAVTAQHLSLPQRAGRALAKLRDVAAVVAVSDIRSKNQPPRCLRSDRKLVLHAVVNPQVDAAKLARAFIYAAMTIRRQFREKIGTARDCRGGRHRVLAARA